MVEYLLQPKIIDWGCWNLAVFNWPMVTISFLTCIYLLKRHVPLGVYAASAMIVPLMGGGTVNFGRHVAVLFPLFVAWADRLHQDALYESVVLLFCGLLALLGAWVGLRLPFVTI
jgi:hypothetical protein